MEYGKDFWCVGKDGRRLASLEFPDLKPFLYPDRTGGWWLREDFTVDVLIGGLWYRITACKGFDYDGASIPRICRSIVGDKMAHDIIVAALFHDLFYCVHHPFFVRREADAFLGNVQQVYYASAAKVKATVAGVTVFGGGPWKKTDAEMREYARFLRVEIIPAA